jgi:battenin
MKSFEIMEPAFEARTESRSNLAAFWLLGLFNNASYVIMIASAVQISNAAVGLVYAAAVLPGLILKATAPYWIHKIPYSTRICLAALAMSSSYAIVALSNTRPLQLTGVVLASLQGALGEATCLSMSSFYSAKATITMWSSGTGAAGMFGYLWVNALHVFGGLGFFATLMAAQITVVAYLAAFFILLESPEARARQVRELISADEQLVGAAMDALDSSQPSFSSTFSGSLHFSGVSGSNNNFEDVSAAGGNADSSSGRGNTSISNNLTISTTNPTETTGLLLQQDQSINEPSLPYYSPPPPRHTLNKSSKASRMSSKERFFQFLSLWPYTIPLFLVYAAEYMMQAGVWASIGIPDVSSPTARQKFYSLSNFMYQTGVFLSRSSGMLWQANRKVLWVMPVVQVGLLVFFLTVAVTHFLYSWLLLIPAGAAGLLGGAVYVNAFTLLAREVEPQYREFSLGAASVADSAGIAVADVSAVFIQGCLFKYNNLVGADYAC